MKKFFVEAWYTQPTYARVEVWAEDQDSAIQYAQHLEMNGALDYDDYGDTIDSGMDVVDTEELKQEEIDIVIAKDKNGTRLQKGDKIRFSISQWDGNKHVDVHHEDEIVSIIREDQDDVLIGIDDANGMYVFIDPQEAEKVNTHSGLSDRDYWLQHGDCPKCRLGNTVKPQAGEFVCNKCSWKH